MAAKVRARAASAPSAQRWRWRFRFDQDPSAGSLLFRYGVTHFHHSSLVEQLRRTAPELQLLECIDTVLFPHGDKRWTGWASMMESRLTDPESHCHQPTVFTSIPHLRKRTMPYCRRFRCKKQ